MTLRPVPSGRAVDVWWFDTRAVTLGPAGLADLSEEEQARAAALVFAADRHRYQVAHVTLRRVLAGYLGSQPAELRFRRDRCPRCGEPARPVLAAAAAAAAPPPWFSLTHSGDAVVVAVAGQPVGVDAEQDPAGCVCSLASAMHPADAAAVAGLAEPDRHQAVIGWWVRTEAILKCLGEGIAHRLGAFPVLQPATGGERRPAGGEGPAAGPGWSLRPLSCPPGYQAALALAGPGGLPAVSMAGPLPGAGASPAGTLNA
jgi:4'-phosphopantetheinyl transferase